MNRSVPDRFWAKVNKAGPVVVPELGECWVWTASVDIGGYGAFGLGGRMHAAHRVSWLLEHGEFPELCALHRCDNRLCVRPAHIFIGTRADNMRDCIDKGRMRRGVLPGASNPAAKLSPDDIRRIRASDGTLATIAAAFGISRSQALRIRRRESWASVE